MSKPANKDGSPVDKADKYKLFFYTLLSKS